MYTDLVISFLFFIFSSWFNYRGSVGRIEGKNTFTGKHQSNLGPVSDSELIALGQGKHKRIALRQGITAGLIYGLFIYGILKLL